MAKYRRKTKWKSILCGILVVATLIGACAGIAAIAKKDTKTISSTAFSVGAIGEDGNYLPKSNKSIYTKDLFECQGLSIEPDFEATGTYQVFYYGADKSFIGATEALNAEDGVYNITPEFNIASFARVMITPDVPVDEDGKEIKDFKIRFYEVVGYANDYTVTVNKKQNPLIVGENVFVYKGIYLFDHDLVQHKPESEGEGAPCSEFVDITGVNSATLYVEKSIFHSENFKFYAYDMDASTKMTILDMTEYDTIDCGDYVLVKIDNLSAFETIMLGLFDRDNTDAINAFKNTKVYIEK